jgi:beta-galactosidase
VLHDLPHWTWPGREGELTPIHCYTNFPKAELFVNGKSQGIRYRKEHHLIERYRIIWEDVRYEPGEIRLAGYDDDGNESASTLIRTAGDPARIVLYPDRAKIESDGDAMAFIRVAVTDAEGTICPHADNLIKFAVDGPANIAAVGNGDPTSLELFKADTRKAFHGLCMVYLSSLIDKRGSIEITASGDGLSSGVCSLKAINQNKETASELS